MPQYMEELSRLFPLSMYLLLAWASSLLLWRLLLKGKGLNGGIWGRTAAGQLPPGPTPLPLIGNFAQIDIRNPHRSFVHWKQQFGPIYTVWLPKPQVVVAGAQELADLLINPAYADIFAERPTFSFLYGIFCNHQPDGDGIILARREVWQKNRRFALSALRNLGMGRSSMSTLIGAHKDALLHRLADSVVHNHGLVSDWHSHFAFCFGNVIQHLVMGRHYTHIDDPEFVHFKRLIDDTIKEFTSVQLLVVDRFPALRRLFPAYWRFIKDGFRLQRFFMREIDEHILRLRDAKVRDGAEESTDETNCFIDAYLLAAAAEGQDWDEPALRLSLTLCSGDIWAGGLETVVTTITWAVLYMLHYPQVQRKLQHELDEHLQTRPFTMANRRELPYFQATVDELQRIVNVLPWNVPHSISREVTVGPWTLPKDTIVMTQYGAVHMDAEVFPEPEVFRPERFLDSEGNYKQSKLLKPFGMGKRSCLGEALARMELTLVFASLLQNFSLEPIPGKMPSLRRNPGMTSTPDPFECIVRLRHEELILE